MANKETAYLYEQIANSIREEILEGHLLPGERLPSVRQMTKRWNCTIGTVQRAYQELGRQGLVASRAGQGTSVIGVPDITDTPLRKAELIHRAEAFLLEVITAGYVVDEIEDAVRQAMERWQAIEKSPAPSSSAAIRFSGSHDIVIAWLASHSSEIIPGFHIELNYAGSLGGLIALAEDAADLCGCHLWDEDTQSYNRPFVKRLLPNMRVAVVTLAERRLGLILPNGNPDNIEDLTSLAKSGIRFANRQRGSGTRVWLDARLQDAAIDPERISGYQKGLMTHSAVARQVAEGNADVGIGLEAAALSYQLDFIHLTNETYQLVIPAAQFERPELRTLVQWLQSDPAKQLMSDIGGYLTETSGEIQWIG